MLFSTYTMPVERDFYYWTPMHYRFGRKSPQERLAEWHQMRRQDRPRNPFAYAHQPRLDA